MKTNINILFSMLLILMGCTAVTSDNESNSSLVPTIAKPEGTLNVGIVIVDGVYNSELVAPMDILHHTVFHTDHGMNVFIVAPVKDPVTTFEGLRIIPDFSFGDSLPNIDVLIVPSAEHSMDSDLQNNELISFVKLKGQQADYVMSLCDGAFVLAKAGLADNKESTTFPSDIPRFKEMFPHLTVHKDVSFVHDGKLITSAGGAKSYDPALYLVEMLYGNEAAKGIAKGLVIDWDVTKIPHITVQND